MFRVARIIPLLFIFVLPGIGCADVAVVDDSENLALLEEQAVYPSAPRAPADEPLAVDDAPAGLLEQGNALNNKVQRLQQELAELRGRLEEQAHKLATMEEQQLTLYKDLDSRLAPGSKKPTHDVPQAPSVVEPSQAAPAPAPFASVDEESVRYLAAYDLLKKKQYPEALAAMNVIAHDYPDSSYAQNAHYWLGGLYLHQHQYAEALTQFDEVLTHPSANKYSASLLKKAYVLAQMNQVPAAKKILQDVISQYPDTLVAKLARKKLTALGD